MIKKVENIILKKRLRKRSEKLKRQNERIRRRETENRNLKNNMRRTAQELEDIKDSLTTGFCPYCETHNMFSCDPEWGLVSYCPRCGARVMLCQMCDKSGSKCDYDARLDICSEM